jgi:hypothetical protein
MILKRPSDFQRKATLDVIICQLSYQKQRPFNISDMDDYHLMKQQAGITWYLDLEASVEEAENVAIETRPQYQPWRAYWPPKCERMMQIWLQSEFPEVLSWRFDRHLPFDRPWRTWTRSACALKDRAEGMSCRPMRDTAGTQLISALFILLNTISEYMNSLPPQSVLTQVAKASSDVDDLIRKCKLHTADPSVFHFLIPLNLYKTEKPYLSRLPSGTELPRTNIRTESQVLKVFDVSGYEPHFTLERSGFQYAKSPIRMEHWNDSSVCSEYIPKVEAWLVKHLKCSDAFVYAYNVSSASVASAKHH